MATSSSKNPASNGLSSFCQEPPLCILWRGEAACLPVGGGVPQRRGQVGLVRFSDGRTKTATVTEQPWPVRECELTAEALEGQGLCLLPVHSGPWHSVHQGSSQYSLKWALLGTELGRKADAFPGRGDRHHNVVVTSEGAGFSRDLEEQVTSA